MDWTYLYSTPAHVNINLSRIELKEKRLSVILKVVCFFPPLSSRVGVFPPFWGVSLFSIFPLGAIFQGFDCYLMKRKWDADGRNTSIIKTKPSVTWKSAEQTALWRGSPKEGLMTSQRVEPIDGWVKSRAWGKDVGWDLTIQHLCWINCLVVWLRKPWADVSVY